MLLFQIATIALAQSPEEEEYQRKLKDYEEKKAIYDRHQAVANVPVAASNDLVPKIPVDQIPPGYAEQLLPTYTGIPVQFHTLDGPVIVPEIVAETQTISPLTALPQAVPPPAVRATPLRAGPQSLRPAPSSNVSVRANFQASRRPVAPARAPAPAPKRPPNLLLFTNARISLPSIVQRLGLGAAAPAPNRVQIEAFPPRRP